MNDVILQNSHSDNDTLLEFDAAWWCHAVAFSQKPGGDDFPIDSATSICPLFL